MSPIEILGLSLGTGFAAGLNLYATAATLGLLHRFGVIVLPGSLDALAHPVVLGVVIALYLVEFVADKIPYVDNAWDVVHTFIRPPAAAVLAYGAYAGVPEHWRVAAALLAGSVALSSHGAKASTRAAANTSPEPFSNWALSLGEDTLAVGLVWFAAAHPLLAIVLVLILVIVSAWVVLKLFRFFVGAVRRVLGREQAGASKSR